MEFYRLLHAWTRRKQYEARILAVGLWQVLGEGFSEGQHAAPARGAQVNGHTFVSAEEIFARAGVKL